MFLNVRRMCWNKYVNKLQQKLNERILPPVPEPTSKEDLDVLTNKVHSVLASKNRSCLPEAKIVS